MIDSSTNSHALKKLNILSTTCVFLYIIIFPKSLLAIDFSDLYEKTAASVLTISTMKFSVSAQGVQVKTGVGSGILVEPKLVITAAHVIDDVDAVYVRFFDETKIKATVVSKDNSTDLALLRLERAHPNSVVAKFGCSDDINIGSQVYIIGAPFGIEQSLSVGILSGRMTKTRAPGGRPVKLLQTDTAINPGNSGGPLYNEYGEVIGIVSFILSQGGGYDGVGFAIAINDAYRELRNSSGFVAGFSGMELTAQQSKVLNVPAEGILVQKVVLGSIADDLGLEHGSVEASIGDQEIVLGGDLIISITCESCETSKEEFTSDVVARYLARNPSPKIKIFRNGSYMHLPDNVEDHAPPEPQQLIMIAP